MSWRGERVLLTGSGGVLGTALLKLLKNTEAHVFAPTRRECNLLDAGQVRSTWNEVKPSVVIHLAGWVAGVQGNLSFAGQAFYENTCINTNVIEASRVAGVRKIVVAGTTAVYSDLVPLPMKEADIWLGAPHGSEAAYGHAKRAMLAQLEAYKMQYGVDFGFMICTNLYGPGDRFDDKYGHVVPSLISRFHAAARAKAPNITIWGDGTPTRDFLFSEDAAAAFIKVVERGQGSFNTATGRTVTIRELVEIIRSVAGYQGEIIWDVSKPKGQQTRSYDIERLAALEWTPRVDLPTGIGRTFEWYDANTQTVRR